MLSGDCIIAHPRWAHSHSWDSVVMLTDVGTTETVGICINVPTDHTVSELLAQHNLPCGCENQTVMQGGDVTQGALVMLHTSEWFSSNTQALTPTLSISSDELMLEKMSMGNTPKWWCWSLGFSVFDTDWLAHSLRASRPHWVLLERPDLEHIYTDCDTLWTDCVELAAQRLIHRHFD